MKNEDHHTNYYTRGNKVKEISTNLAVMYLVFKY